MGEASNPYQAPQSDEDAPEGHSYAAYGDGLIDATRGTRFSNFFIDYIFVLVTNFVLVAIVGSRDASGVMIYPVMIGYYVFFEGIFAATPGKMITKTRVVRLDGGKPLMGQILGRTLSRFVPFEAFSFFSSTSQGWHDRWSKTRVVHAPR
jgi:uncharacterized RDD family membrane protein YckC